MMPIHGRSNAKKSQSPMSDDICAVKSLYTDFSEFVFLGGMAGLVPRTMTVVGMVIRRREGEGGRGGGGMIKMVPGLPGSRSKMSGIVCVCGCGFGCMCTRVWVWVVAGKMWVWVWVVIGCGWL